MARDKVIKLISLAFFHTSLHTLGEKESMMFTDGSCKIYSRRLICIRPLRATLMTLFIQKIKEKEDEKCCFNSCLLTYAIFVHGIVTYEMKAK